MTVVQDAEDLVVEEAVGDREDGETLVRGDLAIGPARQQGDAAVGPYPEAGVALVQGEDDVVGKAVARWKVWKRVPSKRDSPPP